MTFSIIGRCAETGQLGIAISSSSIAVGARCPWVRAGVGAVASQNITLPALGPQILDALERGQLPPAALDQVLTANGWSEYRQVTVIDSHGQVALFTGKQALGVHDAVAGEQCAAAGNLLSSRQVIEAMVHAFEQAEGHLADRLLAAMASKSGKIGFVGGQDIPLVRKFLCGYEQGAKYANPKVEVVSSMTGKVYKPSTGSTRAVWVCENDIDAHAVGTLQNMLMRAKQPWVLDWSALTSMDQKAARALLRSTT